MKVLTELVKAAPLLASGDGLRLLRHSCVDTDLY
jgi:hypothetical protein